MKDPRKVSSFWWFVVSMVCSLGFENRGETAVKRLSAIGEGSLSLIDARVLDVGGSIKKGWRFSCDLFLAGLSPSPHRREWSEVRGGSDSCGDEGLKRQR